MITFDTLYRILAAVARRGGQLTYGDLSARYETVTGEWHEPHGSWDEPLSELNHSLADLRWPPLSAVVVLQEANDTPEPGGRFWGSSPNVPERPRDDDERVVQYAQILGAVHAAPWPEEMPTVPPE